MLYNSKKTRCSTDLSTSTLLERILWIYVHCGQSRINSRNHGIARHSGVCYAGSHVAMQMILNRLGRVFARNSDNQSMTLLSRDGPIRHRQIGQLIPVDRHRSMTEGRLAKSHFHSRVLVSSYVSLIGLESKSKWPSLIVEDYWRFILQLLDRVLRYELLWI